jgi:hypothetical protein
MKSIYYVIIFSTVILLFLFFEYKKNQICEVKDKWGLYTDASCLTENRLISDGFGYDKDFNWFMYRKKDTIIVYKPLDIENRNKIIAGRFSLSRKIDSLNVIKMIDENHFTVISNWQIDTSQAAINVKIFDRRIFKIKETLSGEIYLVYWGPDRGISIMKDYK